ncbi:MAG: hypothetical protein SPG86_06735, partial [Gemmiger sp.]|nr:hypothetical protein [Gemmiger sp.]
MKAVLQQPLLYDLCVHLPRPKNSPLDCFCPAGRTAGPGLFESRTPLLLKKFYTKKKEAQPLARLS